MLSDQNERSKQNSIAWFVYHPLFGKRGPYTSFALDEHIQRGRLKGETKVWRAGMREWKPFEEVEDFKETLTSYSAMPDQPATLGRRVASRLIDLALFSFPIALGLGILLDWILMFTPWDMNYFQNLKIGLTWLILPLAIAAESIWLCMFGNTPGRNLLQIKLKSISKTHLSLSDYLDRNFLMWKNAFGFGIPLLWLWFCYKQLAKLKSGKETAYDTDSRTCVVAEKQSLMPRFFSAFSICIVFYWGFSILSVVEIDSSKETCVDCESSISYLKRKFPNLQGYSTQEIAKVEFQRRGGHSEWLTVKDSEQLERINSALIIIQQELEASPESCKVKIHNSLHQIFELHKAMYIAGSELPSMAAVDLPAKLLLSPAAIGIGPLNFAFFGKQPRCPLVSR